MSEYILPSPFRERGFDPVRKGVNFSTVYVSSFPLSRDISHSFRNLGKFSTYLRGNCCAPFLYILFDVTELSRQNQVAYKNDTTITNSTRHTVNKITNEDFVRRKRRKNKISIRKCWKIIQSSRECKRK